MTLGFVTLSFFVDRQRAAEDEIHDYEEDGDTFESIRAEARRRFPNERLVSVIYYTGNDPVVDLMAEDGLLTELAREMEGPNGQRYGDARVDIHMASFGNDEE